MRGETWMFRILAVVLLIVSVALARSREMFQALWFSVFGVVNAIALWMIPDMLQATSDEEMPSTAEVVNPPYESVDLASLIVDIAQFYDKPLTYKQLCTLLLLIQANYVYNGKQSLIKENMWLSNNVITTRGVETSFRKYKNEIRDKMSLLHFAPGVVSHVAFVVDNFDPAMLSELEHDPAMQRLLRNADDNAGLISDEMISAFWKEMIGGTYETP